MRFPCFLPTSSSFHPGETILPLEWRNLFTLVMRTLHKSDEICALEWNDGNIPSKQGKRIILFLLSFIHLSYMNIVFSSY